MAEAFQDWRQAAATGDARAALYIGVLYDAGLGVAQDYAAAMTWYRQAWDAGSPVGAFNIGVLYDAGLGVAKNPNVAADWYARAAARGYGRAEYNLAMLYEQGLGVPQNRGEAIAHYRRAYHDGIPAARAHLASLGTPVAENVPAAPDTAMDLFQRAQLALLRRGAGDAAAAAALFRASAEQHNPLAEYDLAYCYEHAMGVPRDPGQALAWYQRAGKDAADEGLRAMAQNGAAQLQRRDAKTVISPSMASSRLAAPSTQ